MGEHVRHSSLAMHHSSGAATLALAEEELLQRVRNAHQLGQRAELCALGRILLAALFLARGVGMLVDPGGIARAAVASGVFDAGVLLPVAAAVQLLGGALLAFGYKSRIAAAGLIAYLACVTLVIHHDLTVEANRAVALASLALCGGLLLVIGNGPGALSIDRLQEQRRLRRERL